MKAHRCIFRSIAMLLVPAQVLLSVPVYADPGGKDKSRAQPAPEGQGQPDGPQGRATPG